MFLLQLNSSKSSEANKNKNGRMAHLQSCEVKGFLCKQRIFFAIEAKQIKTSGRMAPLQSCEGFSLQIMKWQIICLYAFYRWSRGIWLRDDIIE